MNKKHFLSLLMLLLAVGGAWADNSVYTIYPVTQQQIAGAYQTSFTSEVTIVTDGVIDSATVNRAREVLAEAGLTGKVAAAPSASTSNLFIGVAGSGGPADTQATTLSLDRSVLTKDGKYDRHILHLYDDHGTAQCVILGESVDAAFYGLASLEQMLETGTQHMATVTINDYADQQIRGIVEGYYGYPYSVEVKKQLMRFMMRMKMNTYMYGAKSDPYHSANWQAPYPTTITDLQERNGYLTQDMVRDLSKMSAATKVNFIWAIHPGNNFVNDNSIVDKIMQKYSSMYDLGVRQFAVFVDDVGVPTNDTDCKTNADRLTALQEAIDAKWNTDGAPAEAQVRPLHFVPQVYTLSWVSEENRKRFYKYLGQTPKKITIYITGWGVWTVPNTSDLATVSEELGRQTAWWWNYPCNDNADGKLYTSDMYHNFSDMSGVNSNSTLPSALTGGLGVVSNPMQEGMVSRTPLFSVADYAWNNAGFNNQTSWEASFNATMDTPEKRQAWRAIAPYLRPSDPEEMATAVANYRKRNPEAFNNLAQQLAPSLKVMQDLEHSDNEADRLLYRDIAPWLGKLAAMLNIGTAMAPATQSKSSDADRWTSYAAGVGDIARLETDTAYTAFALEGMGYGISVSQRQAQPSDNSLYPLMSWLRSTSLEKGFFGTSTTQKARKIGSNSNLTGGLTTRNTNNTSSITAKSLTLEPNDYVGLNLTKAVKPARLDIADTLMANYAVLCSDDGKHWTRLTADNADAVGFVKYVVVSNNTATTRTLALPTGSFSVVYPELAKLSSITMPSETAGEQTGTKGLANAIDGDPETFFAPRHNQVVGDTYTVTLATTQDVHDVRLYFGTKNGDYLEEGRIEASADGNTWTPLNLKGSTETVGGYAQASTYNSDVMYLDFEGNVQNAKYVRLYVTKIPGTKWLRVYDFQVNRQWYDDQFQSTATYANGAPAEELTDKLGYTQAQTALDINYRFVNITYPTAVNIFWAPERWTGAPITVELTSDGQNWTPAGQLGDAMTTIPVEKGVEAMRISAGNTTSNGDASTWLPIYEITETEGTESAPVTGIGRVMVTPAKGASQSNALYNLAGQRVSDGYKGIVISKGRKVLRK